MLRGLTPLAVLVAILALLLGVFATQSEVFNPQKAGAEASRLEAETRAMADKNNFERQMHEIEIEKNRALAQIEIEQRVQREQILSEALAWAALMISLGVFCVLVAGAVYIICRAIKGLRRPPPIRQAVRGDAARVVSFPANRVPTRKKPEDVSA